MASGQISEITVRPLSAAAADLGMSRAEILEQLDRIHTNITSSLEFETQIIFGWLMAMFFVAHRLSRPQILLACAFFLAISMLNLGVIAGEISSIDYWQSFLYDPELSVTQSPSIVGMFASVISNGWGQLVMILLLYAACIWWAFSCRKNQPKEIGSPL